jgi:hypothetical protein
MVFIQVRVHTDASAARAAANALDARALRGCYVLRRFAKSSWAGEFGAQEDEYTSLIPYSAGKITNYHPREATVISKPIPQGHQSNPPDVTKNQIRRNQLDRSSFFKPLLVGDVECTNAM